MKLSVATNFDERFIEACARAPVDEIYGKLPWDHVGGGRAGYSTGTVDRVGLEAHIKSAHQHGIRFNYLLNSVCMGNREWTRNGNGRIRALLDDLCSLGVDAVTVSTPYLAELVKNHYPQLSLKIGIFANIDTPTRARFWQDLGADTLVLESFSINRRMSVLRQIRAAVSCRLQLIANFSCLPNCPMQIYHMTGISHGSNAGDSAPFIDYCVLKCSSTMLARPDNLIKSNWIRPEDTAFYEELGFTEFKLLERNAPTDLMIKRVEAYAQRMSPDNLLELIQPFGFSGSIKKSYGWMLRVLFERPRVVFPLVRLLARRGMLLPLRGTPITLDSRKIPVDFLAQMAVRPCSRDGGCADCGYCTSVRALAYRVDPDYRDECLRLYEKVFKVLC